MIQACVPYLVKKAETLAGGLTLEVSGRTLRLEPISQNVIFPAGAGGLPTMKLGFVYRAVMESFLRGLPELSIIKTTTLRGARAGKRSW